MLKRPIEGTKGPAQTALLMITLQQIEEEEEEDISQLDILPPAWMLGYLEWRKVRFLLAWEDHGVGGDLEFDSSENYAEAHRSAATQVSGAAGLSRT